MKNRLVLIQHVVGVPDKHRPESRPSPLSGAIPDEEWRPQPILAVANTISSSM